MSDSTTEISRPGPSGTLQDVPLQLAVRISPGATLREVAALMEDEKVSCVLLGSGASVVTEHDLAGALAAGLSPSAPAAPVATKVPVWATTATTLAGAIDIMVASRIRHLIVLSPLGEVRGVLSLSDATRFLLGEPQQIVRPRTVASTGPVPAIRTIAVGFDGSADAEAAAGWAMGLGRQLHARVVVVHAVGLLEHLAVPASGALAAQVRTMAYEAGLPEDDVRTEVFDGDPCSVLSRVGSAPVEADLLVVGSRGRSAHHGTLLGSTSHTLAERSPVPLVIVPSMSGGDPRRCS